MGLRMVLQWVRKGLKDGFRSGNDGSLLPNPVPKRDGLQGVWFWATICSGERGYLLQSARVQQQGWMDVSPCKQHD